MGFNNQLINVFFREKKVDIQPELFEKYYTNIFPCPDLFLQFLESKNREQQMVYAKKIVKRMFFCTSNFNLYELFENLLDLDEKYLIV